MSNKNILRKALEQAKHSTVQQFTVVAVVSLNDMPIFACSNRRGSGRVSKWSTHAEEAAVEKCRRQGYDPYDLSMTVLRIGRGSRLMMSKPCSGCQDLIVDFNQVYYSDEDGLIRRLH